jgi:predicted nucleic acid-binding protein
MSQAPLPLQVRRVLIDTSAFFALTAPRDADHHTALAIQQRLITERWRLYTTNLVVAETHALLLTRLGRTIAFSTLHSIDHSTTTIVRISNADETRAREIISQYDDKDFSLTDATSFAVMERLRIPHAFTFDRNFTQYGLPVLTAS